MGAIETESACDMKSLHHFVEYDGSLTDVHISGRGDG